MTNNLTVLLDQHIWLYEHLRLYDCYYVFYSRCMYRLAQKRSHYQV